MEKRPEKARRLTGTAPLLSSLRSTRESQAVLHPELSHQLRLKGITDSFAGLGPCLGYWPMFFQSGRLSMQLTPRTINMSDSQVATSENSEFQLSLETEQGDLCAFCNCLS